MLDLYLVKALHSAAGPATLDVRLTIGPGEFVALYGPSGAGKTTLLRLLAGLTRPDAGYLRVGEQTWYDGPQRQWRRPEQRSIGYVFQDYALFPNMTVRQNLTFALTSHRDAAIVAELLALTELEQLAHRYPAQLSGGQQQRVALARALARRPRLLLLDEPLSAVDNPTRLRLQQMLAEAHQRFELTTIMVSHDPAEVYTLAGRVLELDLGRVIRDGQPVPPLTQSNGLELTATVVEVLSDGREVRLVAGATTLVVPVPAGQTYQPGQVVTLTAAAWGIKPPQT